MSRVVRYAAVLVMAAGLVGCGSAPPPPPDQFYRLDVAAPAALPAPLLSGVVEVSRFTAEGLAGDRAIVYSQRDIPDQVKRYSYQFWMEQPSLLLQDQLVRLLRQANAAATVVTSDLRVPPDYVIQGRIRRFEQVIGSSPAVIIDVDIGVVRVHGNELLSLKTYRVEKPLSSDQVSEAVHGFEAAVNDLFGQFLTDLSGQRR